MSVPVSVLLWRGLTRRCAMCGHGKLFTRWVRMRTRCPGCGLRFRRNPGMWLGSWFLNICVVQVVIVITLLIQVAVLWPERPGWLMFVVLAVVAGLTPVVFFPFSRTIWLAVDLVMRPVSFDDGVAPGVELEQIEQRRNVVGRHRRR